MSSSSTISLAPQQQQQEQENPQCDIVAAEFRLVGQVVFHDPIKTIIRKNKLVIKEVELVVPAPQQAASPSTSSDSAVQQQSQEHEMQQENSEASQMLQAQLDYAQALENRKILQVNSMKNEFDFAMFVQKYDEAQQNQSNNNNNNGNNQAVSLPSGGNRSLLLPTFFAYSENRVVLGSAYMNRNDAFKHLITDKQTLFANIDMDIVLALKNGTLSSEQIPKIQLHAQTLVRKQLFGALKCATQISTALHFLHNNLSCAHNDLKPDNFFANKGAHPFLEQSNLDRSGKYSSDDDRVSYYLADFGFAKQTGFKSLSEAKNFFAKKTATYQAPEILDLVYSQFPQSQQLNLNTLEMQADVFAFGVSLFQILFHSNPFASGACKLNDNYYSLLHTNPTRFWKNPKLAIPLEIYSEMTNIEQLKNLLQGMLHPHPNMRLTSAQVHAHPLLEEIKHYLFAQ